MAKSSICILCDSRGFEVIHQKGQWRYLRCLNCGLVSLFPRATVQMLMQGYQSYLPTDPMEIDRWDTMMKPVVVKSADLIESASPVGQGRLLDVGSGFGFFLREMKARGWNVEGVEVSVQGRQYAQNKWSVCVHPRPLEELSLPSNVFDVVTLFYVIEHVHDPLKLLWEVNRVLKPGGLVLLRWPHSTPIVKMLGPISRKLDLYHTPYHLYDFSPKTAKRMLDRCGFELAQTVIGGYTRLEHCFQRWASAAFGQLGEALWLLTKGMFLLPGVSKTTLAVKGNVCGSDIQGHSQDGKKGSILV